MSSVWKHVHTDNQILPFSVRMCRPHSTATSFARLSRPIVRWTFERSSSFLRVYQPSALAMSEKDVASSLMACSTLVSRAASRMETAGALDASPFRERPVDRWMLRFNSKVLCSRPRQPPWPRSSRPVPSASRGVITTHSRQLDVAVDLEREVYPVDRDYGFCRQRVAVLQSAGR